MSSSPRGPSQNADQSLFHKFSIAALPLPDILDLVYTALFDTALWRRKPGGTDRGPEGSKEPLFRRLSFQVLKASQKYVTDMDVQQPPILRAITQFGRKPITSRMKVLLEAPFQFTDDTGMGPTSYVQHLAPLMIQFQGVDSSLLKDFFAAGLHLTLIRRVWSLWRDRLKFPDAEVEEALIGGLLLAGR